MHPKEEPSVVLYEIQISSRVRNSIAMLVQKRRFLCAAATGQEAMH
jgi:hypothetical protein